MFLGVNPKLIVPAEKMWEQINQAPPDLPRFGDDQIGRYSGKVLVCAAGASLLEMLPVIKKRKEQGVPIVAVKGTLNTLVKNGIVPDFAVFMDAQENQIRFFDNPHPDVTYLIAAQSHPKVFEALRGFNVIVWFSSSLDLLKLSGYKGWYVGGGRTTGLRTINIVRAMGFETIEMYGFDCSFTDAAKSHVYDKTKVLRVIEPYLGERQFKATMDMVGQHTDFLKLMQRAPETRFIVMGDGMLLEALREFITHKDKPCPYYYLPNVENMKVDDTGQLVNAA